MATSTKILLPEGNKPDSSETASRLLQDNHELHHMFFNGEGFHNHINHGLLTLWALEASPTNIEKFYDLNKVFQRPQEPADQKLSLDLADVETFMEYMGDDKYYKAYLDFFSQEITSTSWQEVLQKYLFARDKRADTMLVRLFDSFLHPLIHVGFGVEFEQPAIIAEALAQTACHQEWIQELLLPAEALSRAGCASKNVAELLDAVGADDLILQAPHWNDHDKIHEGILDRAGDRMVHYLAQVQVKPEDLLARTAEMINAAAYLTAGAQRSGKDVKFDFYLLHCLTSAMFFTNFLEQSWLSDTNKARLLEWKIRMDLVMYASRKSPALHITSIRNHEAKHASDWEDIKRRVCLIPDDGHASKVIRAIAHSHKVCKPYQSGEAYRLKDGDWHQLALMAIDSIEIEGEEDHIQFDGPGKAWVRSAGFDEAWVDIPDQVKVES
ncbi:hypothetical protein M409DRAFT_23671 [Zasmidium cellare ATCC 36951]|uniref:Oxidoreductase AflY n=1 Tax=Zasmidium cellare ATCC 36951 TaxID=1080233 RepID=A0A6A6CIB8_ZASCE|nr:uncharacterized protein M409DRAFT_23671 [Zasmidium cellare ATCC 36951]KAF2165940.1 hypothetical protein M409DRAFT_23671 [Zasmidium cellare ATCC 36951]